MTEGYDREDVIVVGHVPWEDWYNAITDNLGYDLDSVFSGIGESGSCFTSDDIFDTCCHSPYPEPDPDWLCFPIRYSHAATAHDHQWILGNLYCKGSFDHVPRGCWVPESGCAKSTDADGWGYTHPVTGYPPDFSLSGPSDSVSVSHASITWDIPVYQTSRSGYSGWWIRDARWLWPSKDMSSAQSVHACDLSVYPDLENLLEYAYTGTCRVRSVTASYISISHTIYQCPEFVWIGNVPYAGPHYDSEIQECSAQAFDATYTVNVYGSDPLSVDSVNVDCETHEFESNVTFDSPPALLFSFTATGAASHFGARASARGHGEDQVVEANVSHNEDEFSVAAGDLATGKLYLWPKASPIWPSISPPESITEIEPPTDEGNRPVYELTAHRELMMKDFCISLKACDLCMAKVFSASFSVTDEDYTPYECTSGATMYLNATGSSECIWLFWDETFECGGETWHADATVTITKMGYDDFVLYVSYSCGSPPHNFTIWWRSQGTVDYPDLTQDEVDALCAGTAVELTKAYVYKDGVGADYVGTIVLQRVFLSATPIT